MSSINSEEFVHGSGANLGFLLVRSANLWNERLMEELANAGFKRMKPSHGSLLIPLFDHGEQSITSIMKFSKLKKQTMTTYVRELKILGIIKERGDPNDKRVKLISLTEEGENLKNGSQIAVNNVNNHFGKLLDRNDFEILHHILDKILKIESKINDRFVY